MQKKVGLAAVLVLLCGVSGYLWMTSSGTETDVTIAEMKETWNCPDCGTQFELTVAQATSMLRAPRHEIICPSCGQGGATRDDIVVRMAGGLPTGGHGDDEDEAEEEEEEKIPEPGGMMSPIRP